ncbi:hypothetical protein IQ235_04855 [Oscillatoriales cyanobacterium LEGE 11467]|uniref:Uncharacterized protein n=1 Tax=Zarconia navalis LEGE 11467 TaxID=1828826 RepID=A0A928VTS3_9CYAN|nr:hypothetical protein [Zarconia navalis]MBE9040122.1 hypothetical protein [Zarconia navalis LEGE 11467]
MSVCYPIEKQNTLKSADFAREPLRNIEASIVAISKLHVRDLDPASLHLRLIQLLMLDFTIDSIASMPQITIRVGVSQFFSIRAANEIDTRLTQIN